MNPTSKETSTRAPVFERKFGFRRGEFLVTSQLLDQYKNPGHLGQLLLASLEFFSEIDPRTTSTINASKPVYLQGELVGYITYKKAGIGQNATRITVVAVKNSYEIDLVEAAQALLK